MESIAVSLRQTHRQTERPVIGYLSSPLLSISLDSLPSTIVLISKTAGTSQIQIVNAILSHFFLVLNLKASILRHKYIKLKLIETFLKPEN